MHGSVDLHCGRFQLGQWSPRDHSRSIRPGDGADSVAADGESQAGWTAMGIHCLMTPSMEGPPPCDTGCKCMNPSFPIHF